MRSVLRPLSSALLLALPALAFAQGALAPTGAPAPTMRSLDQIEPRMGIGAVGGSSTTITISEPGSYLLLGNLSVRGGDGIIITASNVTLDLGGFVISTTANPAAGAALRLGTDVGPNPHNIIVRNGHIAADLALNASDTVVGTGFAYGAISYPIWNTQIADLGIDGAGQGGLVLAGQVLVTNCSVTNCGGNGISAEQVTNCSVSNCIRGINGAVITSSRASNIRQDAIMANRVASDCVGETFSGTGVFAHQAQNCLGASDTGTGLRAHSSATGCTGITQQGINGLLVGADGVATGTAENCRGRAYGTGTGLSAETATNCLGESSASTGLYAGTATNCTAITSGTGAALVVAGSATNCRGKNTTGGTAITAAIAVSCTSAGGKIDVPADKKFLGTP